MPTFDPMSLFANGEQGLLIDKLNPADGYLFQDAAGTIPCTAAGQPVGRITDRSGNGSHAIQPDNDDFRLIMGQDGAGHWYMYFDGIDDYLTAPLGLSGTRQIAMFITLQKASDVQVQWPLSINSSSTGSFSLRAPSAGGVDEYAVLSKGSVVRKAVGTGYSAGTTNVLTCIGDTVLPSVSLRVDGLLVDEDIDFQGAQDYSGKDLNIGRRSSDIRHFSGRIYGLCVLGRTPTAKEISDTEVYLADMSGVTF